MLPNMEENRQELCVAIFCIFTWLGGKEKKTPLYPNSSTWRVNGGETNILIAISVWVKLSSLYLNAYQTYKKT